MIDYWFWACEDDEPARDKFIIELGQDSLWQRVRGEIRADERVSWMQINRTEKPVAIADLLHMMLVTVPSYHISHNKFVFEAAKIPVFAKFLRDAPADLGNYVSNTAFPNERIIPEPYSDAVMRKLGLIVNRTLGIDEDWF